MCWHTNKWLFFYDDKLGLMWTTGYDVMFQEPFPLIVIYKNLSIVSCFKD